MTKIRAHVVRHDRASTIQPAELAVTNPMIRTIPATIPCL
jgi:hypothetical protein